MAEREVFDARMGREKIKASASALAGDFIFPPLTLWRARVLPLRLHFIGDWWLKRKLVKCGGLIADDYCEMWNFLSLINLSVRAMDFIKLFDNWMISR